MRLEADEEVVLALHPHGGALVVPVVVLLTCCGTAGFGLARLDAPWQRWAVVAVAVLVVLRWCVRPWLRWVSTRLVVTDRRVLVRTGLLRRTGRDVPVARVVDVGFRRTVRQRLVGSGTLLVQSDAGWLEVADVPRVERVQRELLALVSRA